MEAMTFTLFLLSLLAGVTMTPLQEMVARNVVVETDESRGSGIVLSTGVVLATFHSLDVDNTIKINGKDARIGLVRPDLDLLVLYGETPEVPDIVFGLGAGIGTEVIAVGNPQTFTGVVSLGHIVYMEGDFIFTDTLAMYGFSGGGVYTTSGQLLGMIQKMCGKEGHGSWMIRAISSEGIIKAVEKKDETP
jgi:S1-C subfamily serine protease